MQFIEPNANRKLCTSVGLHGGQMGDKESVWEQLFESRVNLHKYGEHIEEFLLDVHVRLN